MSDRRGYTQPQILDRFTPSTPPLSGDRFSDRAVTGAGAARVVSVVAVEVGVWASGVAVLEVEQSFPVTSLRDFGMSGDSSLKHSHTSEPPGPATTALISEP